MTLYCFFLRSSVPPDPPSMVGIFVQPVTVTTRAGLISAQIEKNVSKTAKLRYLDGLCGVRCEYILTVAILHLILTDQGTLITQ